MIDLFSLGLCHALLLLTVWRLLGRPDLDREPEPGAEPAPVAERPRGWGAPRA